MEITLTRELEDFVREKMDAGGYRSPSEIVVESLELLRQVDRADRERLQELKRNISASLEQADRGELEDVDDDILRRIRESGERILKESHAGR